MNPGSPLPEPLAPLAAEPEWVQASTAVPLLAWYEQTQLMVYRASAYGLLNWADDPALLALVFC